MRERLARLPGRCADHAESICGPLLKVVIVQRLPSLPIRMVFWEDPYTTSKSLSDHPRKIQSDGFISVVQALENLFYQRGSLTLLYNSRGVGKSTGRASWTGEAERKDYQAIVDWVIANHRTLALGRTDGDINVTSRLVLYCCVSIFL